MNNLIKILVATSLLTVSSMSLAIPTTGSISFSAFGSGSGFDENNVWFGTGFGTSGENAVVTDAKGGFASYFGGGDLAKFTDFTYNPFTTSPQLVWSGTGSVIPTPLSFYLEQVTASEFSSDSLELRGKGYITDGSDQAELRWIYTGNSAGSGNDISFSWSSSTAVPEPGTLALLGLGLAGLGAARRRQKA